MKIKLTTAIIIAFTSFMLVQSCKKDNKNENSVENNNVTNISTLGSNESHNLSQNCMNCHKQGGTGKGWFNAAGTVYDSIGTSTYPNATVKLFTGPNGTGTLKNTIQVDALGNFYTTETIDFGTGLYPSVKGSSTTKYMPSTIANGQCNSCHGVSTGKIWTK